MIDKQHKFIELMLRQPAAAEQIFSLCEKINSEVYQTNVNNLFNPNSLRIPRISQDLSELKHLMKKVYNQDITADSLQLYQDLVLPINHQLIKIGNS